MTNIDIKATFQFCLVCPQDSMALLIGMRWNGQYYSDKVLPFGLRLAPYIFNCFADSVTWVLRNNYGVNHHYHSLLLALPMLMNVITTSFRSNISYLNVPIAEEKLEGPSSTITFLYILLDTTKLEAKVPPEKLSAVQTDLSTWLG